jgi:hypothetical protein
VELVVRPNYLHMEQQDFSVRQNTAPHVRFRLRTKPAASTASWTVKLRIYRDDSYPRADLLLEKTFTNSTTVVNAAVLGVWDSQLTARETAALPLGRCYYEFQRIDAGEEDILTSGRLDVLRGFPVNALSPSVSPSASPSPSEGP